MSLVKSHFEHSFWPKSAFKVQKIQRYHERTILYPFFNEIWPISPSEQMLHFGQHFGVNICDVCCLHHHLTSLVWPKHISYNLMCFRFHFGHKNHPFNDRTNHKKAVFHVFSTKSCYPIFISAKAEIDSKHPKIAYNVF